MSFPNAYYPGYAGGIGSRPRLQSWHPFRQLVAAGTNMNGAWSGGGGSDYSGYGPEPADYDYHSGPPGQVPSGGSYSYHAPTGTGYGVPPQQHHAPVHPPVHSPPLPALSFGGGKSKGGGGGGGKKGYGSTMSALTLLSFLFFVNLLQNCIKDHMDLMKPTVMVMSPDIRQNRFNKMGDMNSREQSSGSSSGTSFSSNAISGANIVMQPADMLASAAMNSAAVMEAMKPMVNLQSPYSGVVGIVNKPSEVSVAPSPLVPAVTQYQTSNPEPEVHYQRPYYDPHQPDVYEHHLPHEPAVQPAKAPQYNPQQQQPTYNYQATPNYINHSLIQQPPPIYAGTTMNQPHYNNEYSHNQPGSHTYTTPRNPFYEHQHPPIYSHRGNHPELSPSSQSLDDNEQRNSHKYDGASQESPQHFQGPVPWSSHSSHSSSPGPIRRATIVSVSPNIKWASVPSNDGDLADFDTEELSETIRNNRYSETSYRG